MDRSFPEALSLRSEGRELLRATAELCAISELPPKIKNFYITLAENSLNGAFDALSPIAEKDFLKIRSEKSAPFYRRMTYTITCRLIKWSDTVSEVETEISIRKGRETVFLKKLSHCWDVLGEIMLPNPLKKRHYTK